MHELIIKAETGFENDGSMRSASVAFSYDNFDQSSLGKPITKKFAQELIKNDRKQNNSNSTDIISVTFEARSLLLLLSQKGCVGIRHYYARKDNGDRTLVLVGVDSKGHDLGSIPCSKSKKGSIIMDKIMEKESSILIEVGGGGKMADFG